MPIGSLLTAAGSIIGSVLGNSGNDAINESQMYHNERMWRLNNEYNTPANQMKRLRLAGINPHFAIQGGQLGTGNSSTPASSINPLPYDFSPIGEGIARSAEIFQQKRVQDADIGLKNAMAENWRARNVTQYYRDLSEIRSILKSADLTDQQRKNLRAQEHEIWINIQSLAERNEVEIDKARSETYLNNALERESRLKAQFQEIVNQFEIPHREKVLRNLDASYSAILAEAAAGNASAAASLADAALKGIEKDNAEKIKDYVVEKAFQEVESIKDDRELKWLQEHYRQTGKAGEWFSAPVPQYKAGLGLKRAERQRKR